MRTTLDIITPTLHPCTPPQDHMIRTSGYAYTLQVEQISYKGLGQGMEI